MQIGTGTNRNINFALGGQSYTTDSQTKRMSAKSVVIKGRCYVPLDVMQTLLGGKRSNEAKTQTVRHDPPPKKVARN